LPNPFLVEDIQRSSRDHSSKESQERSLPKPRRARRLKSKKQWLRPLKRSPLKNKWKRKSKKL
jgi:hypothetical protein